MSTLIHASIPEIPTAKESENYRYISLRDYKWKDFEAKSSLGDDSDSQVTQWKWPEVFENDFFTHLAKNTSAKRLVLKFKGQQKYKLSPDILKDGALQVENVQIHVEKNSELDLLYNLSSDIKNSNHQIHCIQIYLEENAKLNYFFLQDLSENSAIAIRHFINVEKNANFHFNIYQAGGDRSQHRVDVKVSSKGSHVDIQAAQRLRHKQQMDLWINTQHLDSDSTSQTTVWNVLEDESVAVFNGNIKISHEGFRTQAFQSNKNLLLSPTAQVHTLPKLEISTDDVKCSHGASVASLDPAQLFYLESRGIRQDQAEKMLIEAYTYPVISKIPDEELRKKYIVSEEDLV